MTKKVRIENADNSSYKLVVEVWEIRDEGNHLADTKLLTNPTDLVECTIWKDRFIVVREQ